MKNFFITLSLIVFTTIVHSQTINFQWARMMGADNTIGNSGTTGTTISTDIFGNVYSAGTFSDTVDFDTGIGIEYISSSGGNDIYLNKHDATGNYLWTKHFGSSTNDFPFAIRINQNGEILLLGTFSGSIDLNPDTLTTALFTSYGDEDIFILKLSANGNYIWGKQFGSSLVDNGAGMDLDANENIYFTGMFRGTIDMDPSANTYPLTSNGLDDVYMAKLDPSGNLLWAKSIGGSGVDVSSEIKTDPNGNVFTTGNIVLTVDLDPGPGSDILTLPYYGKATFINKLDPAGNQIWTKCFEPHTQANSCNVSSMIFDSVGNIYTTGYIESTIDFNPDSNVIDNLSSVFGTWDIFVCKLNSAGEFRWAKSIGGNNNESGSTIHVDGQQNIYVSGNYSGILDFDPDSIASYNLTAINGYGNYLLKLDSSGNFNRVTNLAGVPIYADFTYLDSGNNFYVTGQFSGTQDFDPGAGISYLTSTGGVGSAYLVKLNFPATVGLQQISVDSNFSIYPNPVNRMVVINSKKPLQNASIKLMNTNGQILLSKTMLYGNQISIDLSDFASGLYMLDIFTEGNKCTLKIMKE